MVSKAVYFAYRYVIFLRGGEYLRYCSEIIQKIQDPYLYLYLKDTEGSIFGFVSYLQDTGGCIFCILSKILFQCIFPNPAARPAAEPIYQYFPLCEIHDIALKLKVKLATFTT